MKTANNTNAGLRRRIRRINDVDDEDEEEDDNDFWSLRGDEHKHDEDDDDDDDDDEYDNDEDISGRDRVHVDHLTSAGR